MVIGRGRCRGHFRKGHVTCGHYGCWATSSCACAHQENAEGIKWPLVTSGSHITTTKKKTRGKAGHEQNILPFMATSGQGVFRLRDFVTSGKKAPLGRIWRNFRLRMHRTYFRTGSLPVTSLPVMWLPVAPHRSSANNNWAVPIYYWQVPRQILSLDSNLDNSDVLST